MAATATRVSELELSTGEVRLAERVPPEDTDTRTEVGQVGTALNRLLEAETWARERLAHFAGQAVRTVVHTPLGEASAAAAIASNGLLLPATGPTPASAPVPAAACRRPP